MNDFTFTISARRRPSSKLWIFESADFILRSEISLFRYLPVRSNILRLWFCDYIFIFNTMFSSFKMQHSINSFFEMLYP